MLIVGKSYSKKKQPNIMMKRLSTRRNLRLSILVFGPFSLIVTLVCSFGLLITLRNGDLALQLAENSPQSLPNLIQYTLFQQSPPEGQVLGESITALEGKTELLRQYLEWQGSPLTPHAGTFIEVAEKYNLPWTLLPAICGRESTFGKQVPIDSYNCWGWGIYGNNVLRFTSWDEAIETVGKGLRENYFDNGLDTLREIEYSYAPPHRGEHRWSDGVEYFQWEIGHFIEVKNR